MNKKRDYIEEIISKKQRLLIGTDRKKQFEKRVHPLVKGFRAIKQLSKDVDYKNEWLKYGAIGYIACLEGYFRLLISDLINSGDPYLTNLKNYRDIKFGMEHIIAIKKEKISLGDYIAHLVPFNSVEDIDYNLTVIIGQEYFKLFNSRPCSKWNTKPMGEVFPELIGNTQKLFEMRHLYAHELATKERVQIRNVEEYIGCAAMLVTNTEDIMNEIFLAKKK